MTDLIFALLTWIGGQTGYNTTLELPNVVFTNKHNICALYGISEKGRCEAAQLKGFYDKQLTIYLGLDFDINNPHHQSRMLHELIHYVQWANGKHTTSCLGHLEVEAYDLQDKWRAGHALKPILSDFNRIILSASCDA